MSRYFEDMAGSAIIPVAKLVIDPNWLLDDLELRLTRCTLAEAPMAGPLRTGTFLPAGESLHRIAGSETRGWWSEHGLSEFDRQFHRRIIDAMLERSPLYLAWAAVPLVAGYLDHLLDAEVLMGLVEWVTTSEHVERVVRDAVALSLVAPWLEQQSETQAQETLVGLCRSPDPAKMRMGFIGAASYVRDRERVGSELQSAALDFCWPAANRADRETAMAVGWVLKELVHKDEERVFPELLTRVHELSRQAMRTAVEGLPRELRVRLTSEWLGRVHGGSPKAASMGPRSVTRVGRWRHD